VQSAKLAVASIKQDQVLLRNVPKKITIKHIADAFLDAISFTLYDKTFPGSNFCHVALCFKNNKQPTKILKMTDFNFVGKKVYTFPACMQFLHDFPKGEPEPVIEETGNGTKVKEEPLSK
jgi:hypothetical protein